MSLFFNKGPINNKPVLFQLLNGCEIGDLPLSEPVMA